MRLLRLISTSKHVHCDSNFVSVHYMFYATVYTVNRFWSGITEMKSMSIF